ncbi:MAG: TIGR04141 family sporadically distributed protein [Labilibaculum sp.]|nr:DUF6119 family protein [Labilibaculum sp.]MBI9056810.1 TIGR04141 family sporadically distributed protein [Labilibaculum sp.]
MAHNPKIYAINKGHRLFKGITDSKKIIKVIIEFSIKKNGLKTTFDIQQIKSLKKDGITYFLYTYNTNEIISDWEDFLPNELGRSEDFTQQKLSLILFIETEYDMYCVIGGSAYQIIVPFIDHSFGLNTYARIMKPEEDELASIRSRGITGARAGISEQFRDNYKIIDFIKFGKIPKEIHLKLSTEISNLHFFFLQNKQGERMQIYAGKAIKIKKGVNFKTLHRIILELGVISELSPSDYLSSYKEITDTNTIEQKLRPELIRRLLEDTRNIEGINPIFNKVFEHDFCNPNNIELFYEADEYKLKEKSENNRYRIFKTVTDRKDIYENVMKRAMEVCGTSNSFSFQVFLQGVRITCVQNKKQTIGSSFLYHISTEFQLDGTPYFLIDTKWYSLRDSFVKDLIISVKHVLKTYKAPEYILEKPWNKSTLRTEKAYNESYDNNSGYIVIDTIIVDGVELCDLLYYDDENLYLIHVKYGFSAKMRELTNQITISARRLKEAMSGSDSKFIEQQYDKIIGKGRSVNDLSLEGFKQLFTRKITYVLAFTSHLNEDLCVENNIERFDSNIARFSMIQCSSEMRANYYDLLVCQIKRE